MVRPITWLLVGLVVLILLVKALFFGVVAWQCIASSLDVYFLESQMVHLAQRVRQGESLYPDWHQPPHVANVFGPVYFELVGHLGRLLNCDTHGLRLLGRSVSLVSVIGSSLLAGFLVRQYGRVAVVSCFLSAMGTPLLFGFGFMCRSDSLAELLGFAGFWLAISGRWVGYSALLLGLAALTRQPAGIYFLASLVVLLMTRRPSRAMVLAILFVGLTASTIAALMLFQEPRIVESLVLEAGSPRSVDQALRVAQKTTRRGLDIFVVTICSLVLTRARNPFAFLGCVALVSGLVLSAKSGSDVNYFLPMRLPAAVLMGMALSRLLTHAGRLVHAPAALGLCLISATQVPFWILETVRQFDPTRISKQGILVRNVEASIRLGKESPVLTDVDEIALAQGRSAAFVDPFLFRMLVETGRLDPGSIVQRIEERQYEYIITRVDVFDPMYLRMEFGFPKDITESIKRNYSHWQSSAFQYYRPRTRTE